MTTIQIVGIVVASAIVVLLVLALYVTRRRDEEPAEDAAAASPEEHGSFLDAPLTDTLSGLGKVDSPTREAGAPADLGPLRAAAGSAGTHPGPEHDLGLDWGRGAEPDDAQTTGEIEAAAPDDLEDTGEIRLPAGPTTPAARRQVPLHDIIVTTSEKVVDLEDPEVRRMLADLVTFEIDQAAQYRQQGQTVDAVLQLTEAEKICKALDMPETAERISRMMADLNA